MLFDQIWQADMKGNGLLPLITGLSDDQKDTSPCLKEANEKWFHFSSCACY
ncbi:hypothetical protein [Paenibacillus sp. IHBB 10380]|uniref:hypothetical protein n=1 Tax=Paenibacillus sp. IHBB 10380 TaxID=1566358 RepID=UPI001364DB46|nr:hypothetical protein [Paenibacillus sp. IHBB 10380]